MRIFFILLIEIIHIYMTDYSLTKSVFGQHRVLQLAERSETHSILCGNTEHVE